MQTSPTTVRGRLLQPALWCIGLGLLANAAVAVYNRHARAGLPILFSGTPAFARGVKGRMLGANGIYMMPGQLGPQQYGVFLMDLDSGTLCVYETLPDRARLRLVAARNFQYDRFLKDFNNESPTPHQVKRLVMQQRQRRKHAKINKQANK